MLKTVLRALIHGESGIGKSWFGDTAPGPRLHIDLEGRAQYTPSGPKILWDIASGAAPPVWDGSWNTCIVVCPDFETLNLIYQWLRSGQHPFVSVIVDSLMEAQKRCQDVVVPGIGQLDQQNWGEMLRRLEKMVRSYRDLTLIPANTVTSVIFITGSRHNDGCWEPMLQGQMKDLVPYYMDVVGYLHKQPIQQADGTIGFQRALLIDKQPGFIAKDNTDKLVKHYGPVIPLPDDGQQYITELMSLLETNTGVPAGEGVAA